MKISLSLIQFVEVNSILLHLVFYAKEKQLNICILLKWKNENVGLSVHKKKLELSRAPAYFMLWGMKVADDDSSEFTVYGNERMIASPFSFINRVILKR